MSTAALAARLGDRVAFRYDDESYAWSDVVLASGARGTWATLVHGAVAGLQALGSLTPVASAAVERELPERRTRFRQDRGLLTADAFTAWLARWEVSVPAWQSYLRREHARELVLPNEGDREPDADEVLADAVHAQAVLSGFIVDEAEVLAEDRALVDALPEGPDRAGRLARLVAAGALARERAVADDAAVSELVEEHRLDWSIVGARMLVLGTQDAAEEAALVVRHDGRSLEEVAALCRSALQVLSGALSEAPVPLQGLLAGARPGDLVGPVEDDGRFLVAEVTDRRDASPDDAATRARAAAVLVARAVELGTRSRLRWVDGG